MSEVVSVTPNELIKAKQEPDIVKVPARLVLALNGTGGPGEPAFSAAIGALYGISYTLRFIRKKAGKPVFKVGVLEGEWSAEGANHPDYGTPLQNTWRWRLQMCAPSDVTVAELGAAINEATTKRGGKLEGSEQAQHVQLVQIEPAQYARVLHLGPYSTEPESFAKIAHLLATKGLKREPWHLEVYLLDPSRTVAEKLKTVLLTKISD